MKAGVHFLIFEKLLDLHIPEKEEKRFKKISSRQKLSLPAVDVPLESIFNSWKIIRSSYIYINQNKKKRYKSIIETKIVCIVSNN